MIKFYFMKTRRLLTLWLFLAGLLLGYTKAYAQGGGSAAGLVLVSSTDFSVSGAESKSFNVIDSLNGFKGIFSPEISVGEDFSLPSDVYTDPSETTFLSGKHYGISYRSHSLDTLRFARTTDDWGIVFSSGDKSVLSNTLLLNYRVGGLKIGGKYSVEIEVCNPHSASYLEPSGSNKTPHLREGYHLTLKIGTNNYQNLPDGFDVMVPYYADSSRVYTISSSASADLRRGAITNGTLDVNVYMSNSSSNSAVKIKSIKVYAEVDPVVVGQYSECAGGKKATFKLKDTYDNCKYQWYKDGSAISGATNSSYTHTTGNVDGQEYTFHCLITSAEGERIKSKSWKFTDRLCCIDDNGKPTGEKLIWQDDFGTFTEKGKYWIWDYSDINNPKKVEKTTADGWTYELPYSIPGAIYDSNLDVGEGKYSVAANVTNESASDGTKWGWQTITFYGKYLASGSMSPGENTYISPYDYAPDHTVSSVDAPKGYGAMLFLNCGNEAGETIYSRTLSGLSQYSGKKFTAKCYVSTWSNASVPIQICIRVTDLNTGTSYTSETVERYAYHSGASEYDVRTAWDEVSASIELTGEDPKMKLEVISKGGGADNNQKGNDLLLDDIQVWVCGDDTAETNFFDGYNPVIVGDTIRCASGISRYVISENSLPSGCYYTWYYDGDSTGYAGVDETVAFIGTNYRPSEGGKHTLSCSIVSPDLKDTMVISLDIMVDVIEVSLSTTKSEGFEMGWMEIIVDSSSSNVDEYVWKVNDYSFSGKNNIQKFTYDDMRSGFVRVSVESDNGCYGISDSLAFVIPPVFDTPGGTFKDTLVWEETFGYFNDLNGKSYSIVEYSDIEHSQKIEKQTDSKFRYELEDAPMGYEFSAEGKVLSGQYTVAASVNDYLFADCIGCYDPIKEKDTNLVIDHSGFMEGCALYINATPESKNEVIYSRVISGLQKKIRYEFNAFFTTFNGEEDSLKVRVSEVGNPSNMVEYTAKSIKGSNARPDRWCILTADFFTKEGNSILVEFINVNESDKGNVIVIDDLRLLTYHETLIADVDPISAKNADDIVNVYTVSGALVKANVKRSEALNGLLEGIYVVGNEKMIVR